VREPLRLLTIVVSNVVPRYRYNTEVPQVPDDGVRDQLIVTVLPLVQTVELVGLVTVIDAIH
tara:strand:- start:3683 stop:3868 length:186 start_codon:yes stop_codon:yes gene_type:complete